MNNIISIRDAALTYQARNGEVEALRSVSFDVAEGEFVSIVGPSGCGKSTVSKVISGLYQPWGGEVLFDGVPLGELPPEVVNASVSTVSQNITLFSGTIRDNITMWNDNILEKDMPTALKIVSSESLLSLSNVNKEPKSKPTGKALPKIFGIS